MAHEMLVCMLRIGER